MTEKKEPVTKENLEDEAKSHPPVNIAIPTISKAKFDAIKAIAESNLLLAKSLNGPVVQAIISHNIITGAQGTAISIESQPDDVQHKIWDSFVSGKS